MEKDYVIVLAEIGRHWWGGTTSGNPPALHDLSDAFPHWEIKTNHVDNTQRQEDREEREKGIVTYRSRESSTSG